MRGEWTDDQLQLVKQVVGPTAHAINRKYYRFTEAQDIQQEMWVWVFKHHGEVMSFIDREDKQELRSGLSALSKALYRAADKYCRKEKAKKSGYKWTDEFFYTRQLIEAVLIAAANDGKMLENTVNDHVRRIKSKAETGDIMAMIADVTKAVDSLDTDTAAMVRMHVALGIPTTKIAEHYGISRQAVDQRIDRAFETLVFELGGPSPW